MMLVFGVKDLTYMPFSLVFASDIKDRDTIFNKKEFVKRRKE